ncbi:unnamed protein product [Protopolystoma xenopodis]|uniref:Uncharacterized protein n=1 Tax=Protopolystoma xenopodis TaxID=117903 RepID=A0A3S5AQD6_9PLAT|nr:unnamed protein product [Protopolystoma xenopodis]
MKCVSRAWQLWTADLPVSTAYPNRQPVTWQDPLNAGAIKYSVELVRTVLARLVGAQNATAQKGPQGGARWSKRPTKKVPRQQRHGANEHDCLDKLPSSGSP